MTILVLTSLTLSTEATIYNKAKPVNNTLMAMKSNEAKIVALNPNLLGIYYYALGYKSRESESWAYQAGSMDCRDDFMANITGKEVRFRSGPSSSQQYLLSNIAKTMTCFPTQAGYTILNMSGYSLDIDLNMSQIRLWYKPSYDNWLNVYGTQLYPMNGFSVRYDEESDTCLTKMSNYTHMKVRRDGKIVYDRAEHWT